MTGSGTIVLSFIICGGTSKESVLPSSIVVTPDDGVAGVVGGCDGVCAGVGCGSGVGVVTGGAVVPVPPPTVKLITSIRSEAGEPDGGYVLVENKRNS
jgi:hypothetical protein